VTALPDKKKFFFTFFPATGFYSSMESKLLTLADVRSVTITMEHFNIRRSLLDFALYVFFPPFILFDFVFHTLAWDRILDWLRPISKDLTKGRRSTNVFFPYDFFVILSSKFSAYWIFISKFFLAFA